MATILRFRRYTTSEHTFAGQGGELTIDTDKKTIRVHDGVTTGGTILATETWVNDLISYVSNNYDTSTVVDGKVSDALTTVNTILEDYDTSTEVDGKITAEALVTDGKITTALDSVDTILLDYDTSTEVDGKITTAISNLVDGAPTALNTLNELAAALDDDASYAATITTALGTKAPLESPALTGTPTAPTAATSVNNTQIATTAFVQSLIDQAIRAAFPGGIITVWKGSIATIPTGYVLCDGTNGTPDLRDKFVPGAGGVYSVGDNGGSNDVTLVEANIPAHSHDGTTSAEGAHRHAVANGDTVNSTTTNPLSTSNFIGKTGSMSSTSNNYILGGSTTEPTQGLTAEEPDHTHTYTTSSVGLGESFDNRPPYYALCYIMKVWA